jgi:hypothetical protein
MWAGQPGQLVDTTPLAYSRIKGAMFGVDLAGTPTSENASIR